MLASVNVNGAAVAVYELMDKFKNLKLENGKLKAMAFEVKE